MTLDTGTRMTRITDEMLANLDGKSPGRHRPERVATKVIRPEQRAAALTPVPSPSTQQPPVPEVGPAGSRLGVFAMIRHNLGKFRP